jgi:hypothetical protein
VPTRARTPGRRAPIGRLGVALLSLSSSGCFAFDELWPKDEGRAMTGCNATRVQPVVPAGNDIAVPETDADVNLHSITIRGSGSSYVGAISLQNGQGLVELGCQQTQLVVYERDTTEDSVHFNALAVAADRIYRVRLNCTDRGALYSVHALGTDGARSTYERAAGTCDELENPTTSRVQLPSLGAPYPPPLTGYVIDGDSISLASDGHGTLAVDSLEGALIPFGAASCVEACPGREYDFLYALFWQPDEPSVGMASLWLYRDGSLSVRISAMLPGLTPGPSSSFTATFSTP